MSQVRKYQNAGKLDLPNTGPVIDPAKKAKLKFKVNGQDLEIDEDEFRGMYDSAYKDFLSRGWATDKHSQSWGNTFEKIIDNARKGQYSFNTSSEDATNIEYEDKDGEGGAGENSTLGLNKKGKTAKTPFFDKLFGAIKDESVQASLLNHKIGEFIANKYKGLKTQDEKDKEWVGKVDFLTSMGDYQKAAQGAGSKDFLSQYWDKEDNDNSDRERYIRQYITGNSKLNELMKPENQRYMDLLSKEKGVNFNAIKAVQSRLAQNGYKATYDDLREYSEAIGMGNSNYDYYKRKLSKEELDKLKQDEANKLQAEKDAKTNAANAIKQKEQQKIDAARANIINGIDMRSQLGDRNGTFAISARNGDLYDPMYIANGREVTYEQWLAHAAANEGANKNRLAYEKNYRNLLYKNLPNLEAEGYIDNFDDKKEHPLGVQNDDLYGALLKRGERGPQMFRNLTGHYAQMPFFQQKGWQNGSIMEGMEEISNSGMYRRVAYLVNDAGDIIKGRLNNGIFTDIKGKKYNLGMVNINPNDARLKDFTTRAKLKPVQATLRVKNPSSNQSSFYGSLQDKKKTKAARNGMKLLPIYQKGGAVSRPVESTMGRFFDGRMSTADKFRVGALAGDVGTLIASFIPGANVATAGTGALSTTADLTANVMQDGLDWNDVKNAAVGYGLDAATLIPGAGGIAKSAKVMRGVKAAAPYLSRAFAAYGLYNAGKVLNKAVKGEDLTISDWRSLSTGLLALRGGLGIRATGKAIKPKTTPESVVATVKTKVKNEAGELVDVTKRIKVPLSQNQLAELKKIGKGQDQIIAANKMVADNIKASSKYKDVNVDDIKVDTDIRSRLAGNPLTKKANRESVSIKDGATTGYDIRSRDEAKGWWDDKYLWWTNKMMKTKGKSANNDNASGSKVEKEPSAAEKANLLIKKITDKPQLALPQMGTHVESVRPAPMTPWQTSAFGIPKVSNPTFKVGDLIGQNRNGSMSKYKGFVTNRGIQSVFRKGGKIVKYQGGGTNRKRAGDSASPGAAGLDPLRKAGTWLDTNFKNSDIMGLARMMAVTNVNKNYDTRVERPIMQHAAEPIKSVTGNAMVTHAYNTGANQTMQTAKNMLGADATANKLMMLSANDSANKMRIEGALKNAEIIDQNRAQSEQLAMQSAIARSQIANQNIETLTKADQSEREGNNLKNKLVAQPIVQWMQGKEADMKLAEQQNMQLDNKIAGAKAQLRLTNNENYLKDKTEFDRLANLRANLQAKNSDFTEGSKEMNDYIALNKKLSNASNIINLFSLELARNPKLDINRFFEQNGITDYKLENGGKLSATDKMKIAQDKINYKANENYIKNYLTLLKETRKEQKRDVESSLKKINSLIKNALEI